MTMLQCGKNTLDLSRPVVMGILNITPDSFSDGGRFLHPDDALRQALRMCDEGAGMIDIGAESTRPGAQAVTEQEELDRVLPIIEKLRQECDVIISVDTSTASVIQEAAARGAGFINDVRALQRAGALEAAAKTGLPVCLMHMQGSPATMQNNPQYADIFSEISGFFRQRIQACLEAGIAHERIVLDPGFGFGKTLPHNVALLKGLSRFESLGLPLLVGLSRKSMLGTILGGAAVDQRLYAGVAGAVIAALNGARILRVHDVKPTIDALAVVTAFQEQGI